MTLLTQVLSVILNTAYTTVVPKLILEIKITFTLIVKVSFLLQSRALTHHLQVVSPLIHPCVLIDCIAELK